MRPGVAVLSLSIHILIALAALHQRPTRAHRISRLHHISLPLFDHLSWLLSGVTPNDLTYATSPTKPVVAHMMVGNTYPYQLEHWKKDINLALAYGIDGFALNIGSDDWQGSRVADAYAAAQGTRFQLFISFDMTVIPCGSRADAKRIRRYITDYQSHPNQMKFNDRLVVSTFAGESCRFGTNSLNQGWLETLKSAGMPPVWFVPSFFVDPSEFPGLTVMDGYFSWNAGWPMADQEITFNTDKRALDQLSGRGYVAPCSPWFFTHYGLETYNKNFVYSGDNWLFVERWEHLVANRVQLDMIEVLTWSTSYTE